MSAAAPTKSERSAADAQAALGVGATRSLERVLAAMGKLNGAPIAFELVDDVPQGGVLCALPALLAQGLLRHTRQTFDLPAGFYPLETYFLALGFLALARVLSLEAMRYEPPGEWGKLLGLDRIPEVRTLRAKLGQLCQPGGRAQQWSQSLSQAWLAGSQQSVGTTYVDGHVRVYHEKLTQLPRRYVARERLRLRGTTDYWVNAMDGQPLFVVTAPVDPGLITVLRQSVIPRLKADLPQTERWTAQKAQLLQAIQARQKQLEELKASRRQTAKHVTLKELPEAQRFGQLRTDKKHLVDTIKLIAYRAETALVQIVRETLRRWDDARALVRQVLASAVDLRPDPAHQTLTVRLHRLATTAHDQTLRHLCEELTATETVYPGTDLKLVYELVGEPPPQTNTELPPKPG